MDKDSGRTIVNDGENNSIDDKGGSSSGLVTIETTGSESNKSLMMTSSLGRSSSQDSCNRQAVGVVGHEHDSSANNNQQLIEIGQMNPPLPNQCPNCCLVNNNNEYFHQRQQQQNQNQQPIIVTRTAPSLVDGRQQQSSEEAQSSTGTGAAVLTSGTDAELLANQQQQQQQAAAFYQHLLAAAGRPAADGQGSSHGLLHPFSAAMTNAGGGVPSGNPSPRLSPNLFRQFSYPGFQMEDLNGGGGRGVEAGGGGENNPGSYAYNRQMELSRAKLKATSRTSALLSGFAMIALVELDYPSSGSTQPFLIPFGVITTLLVSVHLLALMMSTCILPHLEISSPTDSPHVRLKWYIEVSWFFSTCLGLLLFLLEIAVIFWIKFKVAKYEVAAYVTTGLLIPVVLLFLLFTYDFYQKLMLHKYEYMTKELGQLQSLLATSQFADHPPQPPPPNHPLSNIHLHPPPALLQHQNSSMSNMLGGVGGGGVGGGSVSRKSSNMVRSNSGSAPTLNSQNIPQHYQHQLPIVYDREGDAMTSFPTLRSTTAKNNTTTTRDDGGGSSDESSPSRMLIKMDQLSSTGVDATNFNNNISATAAPPSAVHSEQSRQSQQPSQSQQVRFS